MNIDDAVFVVVDIETTGLDPKIDRIVEIAAVATTSDGITGMWAELVDGRPVTPETSAVHGLVDADLIHARAWGIVREQLDAFAEHMTEVFRPMLVAHNAAFDSAFVTGAGPSPEWICTKRIAQQLWPDAPQHRNQTLRYWLELQVDTFGIAPHRALGDALATAALLRRELNHGKHSLGLETVEDILTLSNAPILLKNWPFGKYRTQPLSSDLDYVRWMLKNNKDLDTDLRYSLLETLKSA